MGPTPRVSVVMAVHNGAGHLREAVECILRQSLQELEFVIVDDGSTDATGEVLRAFDDPRLVLVANSRRLGLAASLNAGIARARADLIARHDADDISEPDRLERQVELMERRSAVAVAGTWFTAVDESGRSVAKRPPADVTEIRWRLLFHCPLIHSGVILRKTVLEQVGGYDESLRYAEDYDLWCRIALRHELTNVERYLVRVRTNASSMTSTFGDVVAEAPETIALAHLQEIISRGDSTLPFDRNDLRVALSLLFRPQLGAEPGEAIATSRKLLRLHAAFSRAYGLSGAAEAAHRRQLRRQLARRLAGLAAERARAGAAREAAEVGRAATRMHAVAAARQWAASVAHRFPARRHAAEGLPRTPPAADR